MVTTKWHVDGWSLTKREGVGVNIVFFCSFPNLFFSGTIRSKSLTLNVGGFDHFLDSCKRHTDQPSVYETISGQLDPSVLT